MTTTIEREEHRLTGERLLAQVKELVRAGNVRRIIIRNEEGRVLLEVPLTVGVVGAVLVPVWAAIGAVAALVNDCSIVVEREKEEAPGRTPLQAALLEVEHIPEAERHTDPEC